MPEQLSLFDDRITMRNRGVQKLLDLDFEGAREAFTKCRNVYPTSADLEHELEIAEFLTRKKASLRDDLPVLEKIQDAYTLWEEFDSYAQQIGYRNEAIIRNLQKSYFTKLTREVGTLGLDGGTLVKDGTPVGLAYLFAGNFTEATRLLQETVLKDPNNARSYAYLGGC